MKTSTAISLCLAQTLAFSQTPSVSTPQARLNSKREVCEFILSLGSSEWRVIPLPKKVQVSNATESRLFTTLNSYGPFGIDGVFGQEFTSSLKSASKPTSLLTIRSEKASYQELGQWQWWEISVPWVSQGSGAYPVFILVLHKPTGAWTFADLNTLGPDDTNHAGLDLHGGLLLSYAVSFRPRSGDYWERTAQVHFHIQDSKHVKADKVFLSPHP